MSEKNSLVFPTVAEGVEEAETGGMDYSVHYRFNFLSDGVPEKDSFSLPTVAEGVEGA